MEELKLEGAEPASNSETAALVAVEIVPDDIALPAEEKQTLVQAYTGFWQRAQAIAETAKTVTDPKVARAVRLQLRAIRIEAEHKRKSLKETVLLVGKAIDGANNFFLGFVGPIEQALDDIEKKAEREAAAAKAALTDLRREALRPFLDLSVPLPTNLGDLTEEQWKVTLDNAKLLHEAKEERKRKEAEEAAERARLAAEEQKRQAEENERLRKEAAEREAREAEERKKREEQRAALAARVDKVAALGGIPGDHKLDEMSENAFAALLKKLEKAKQKRDAQEAAERQQREAAEEAARKEREAREAAEKEAQRLRDEQAQRAAEAEAQRLRDEQAPDKDKFLKLAATLRTLTPETVSPGGKKLADEVRGQFEKFAVWLEKKAAPL